MHIGIDLGTTNSCSACSSVLSPQGTSVPNGEILFGKESKNRQSSLTSNTVFEVKHLIGRKISDPEVQQNITSHSKYIPPRWPFRVESDNTNQDNPVVILPHQGEERRFRPEQLLGMFLKLLRENAEEFLNDAVTSATITVPASFEAAQRQATMDAGYIAGFERIELLNEPTAAALAYKHFHPYSIGQKLLILNLQ
ncbi:hypothetical protein RCL1_005160 [Eukaryota sp. TZLM3-RCL]